jgi:hypothetical protein
MTYSLHKWDLSWKNPSGFPVNFLWEPEMAEAYPETKSFIQLAVFQRKVSFSRSFLNYFLGTLTQVGNKILHIWNSFDQRPHLRTLRTLQPPLQHTKNSLSTSLCITTFLNTKWRAAFLRIWEYCTYLRHFRRSSWTLPGLSSPSFNIQLPRLSS